MTAVLVPTAPRLMLRLLALLLLLFAGCGGGDADAPADVDAAPLDTTDYRSTGAAEWSYRGDAGPDFWGILSPDYAACRGDGQSPIDLVGALESEALPRLDVDTRPAPVQLEYTGLAVEARAADAGALTWRGRRYDLDHVVFHTPSEHRIEGDRTTASLQYHFRADSLWAVVVVFVEIGPDPHPAAAQLWAQMPDPAAQEPRPVGAGGPTTLDLGAFFPPDRSYFTYTGSLSSPPCTEGVPWFLFEQPVAFSREQVLALQRLQANNGRPLQRLNNRTIRYRKVEPQPGEAAPAAGSDGQAPRRSSGGAGRQ